MLTTGVAASGSKSKKGSSVDTAVLAVIFPTLHRCMCGQSAQPALTALLVGPGSHHVVATAHQEPDAAPKVNQNYRCKSIAFSKENPNEQPSA